MNREKFGNAIGTALSTFLTVYVALLIGKEIGRREAIMETLANDIDRWREQAYPKEMEKTETEIPDKVRTATIDNQPLPQWWKRDYFGLSVPSWGIAGLGIVALALWAIVTLG